MATIIGGIGTSHVPTIGVTYDKGDWLGLVRHGVNSFVLEKFGRVVKMSNLEVYARMRGESFEDFMKTRRVPEAC